MTRESDKRHDAARSLPHSPPCSRDKAHGLTAIVQRTICSLGSLISPIGQHAVQESGLRHRLSHHAKANCCNAACNCCLTCLQAEEMYWGS